MVQFFLKDLRAKNFQAWNSKLPTLSVCVCVLWGGGWLLYQNSWLLAYAKRNKHFGRVCACLRIHSSEPTVETKVMESDIVVRIGQVHWYVSSLGGRFMQCHIELFCDEEREGWQKEVFISWSNCLMSKNLEIWTTLSPLDELISCNSQTIYMMSFLGVPKQILNKLDFINLISFGGDNHKKKNKEL